MVSSASFSPAAASAPGQSSIADRLNGFFAPRSLAVVGASESAYWGRNAITNLLDNGYTGRIIPVNPKRKTVLGIECAPNLRELSHPVDLVYVAAPIDAVPTVLADAAYAGIRNAVIISAGFGEAGEAGKQLQESLVRTTTDNGIVVLGPNCPGFINFSDGVSAYGQQVPNDMPKGRVGIILQSGALTTVILKLARAHGVGLSKVVCMGNEAMVRSVDVMEHMIADKSTKVIAMFLEQIRDGDRFLQLARRALDAGKAVVVFKVGRTPEGQKAALAHTGAVAGDDAVVEAALRQTGVVRVHSLEELLITAGLLDRIPELKGPRMAVITGSGGACDIIADRASDEGLQLSSFSADTLAELKEYLPAFATVQNPLDTAAVDTVRDTGTAATAMDVVAEIVSRDTNFDFILYNGFNVVPQVAGNPEDQAKQAARMALFGQMQKKSEHPIIPVSLSCLEVGPFARSLYDANDMFILGGIEFGLKAVGHAVRWSKARERLNTPAAKLPTISQVSVTPREGAWSEFEGRRFLEKSGVALVPARLVDNEEDAVAAGAKLGYPLVLKICSSAIAHKSDIGGVALNLRNEEEVRAAFSKITAAGQKAAPGQVDGVLVSPMRPRGVELFAGVTVDPSFGPTLAVGLGGIWIEVLRDVSLRVLPVSETDVVEMLSSLRAKPLLDGVRGGPKVDIDKAAKAICKIANASLAIGPSLQAFEVNPIWALDDRIEALDVLVVTGDGQGQPH